MNRKTVRSLAGILSLSGILCLVSSLVIAAAFDFAGTWKGEYSATATPGGVPGATGNAPAAGGRGGRGGGGGGGGPQKITLRVKINKEKASGNFTMGTAAAEDIREGKIDGNKLSFKTGLAPATIYDYEAVLIGEALSVTRTSEGGRGGRPQVFTLMRSK